AIRQASAGSSILHNDRFPARHIAEGPITDPRVLEFHAGWLGATELSSRLLNVGLIGVWCTSDLLCKANPPTLAFQYLSIVGVAEVGMSIRLSYGRQHA